ncbi:MAG: CapA family protein [Patescibacteria group bacterium UBA2163]
MIFGGDMMFDRYIRRILEMYGAEYLFSCITPTLSEADMVVANLEGPITNNPSVSSGSVIGSPENFIFTFPSYTAELLQYHNIGIVHIGNNHIGNFGMEGIRETHMYLKDAGVQYFGVTKDTLETKIKDVPLTFVSYNEFGGDKSARVTADIADAKRKGRVVVVFAHWGDEYVSTPDRVKQLARDFADAGAHVVVGAHPHVVQKSEYYNGAVIYYSLGNFIFDQYFNAEVRSGLLLEITFSKQGVSGLKEVPIELVADGRTCLADTSREVR